MATLALSLAGQVVGGAVGGPIGATIGRALGALAGSAVDTMLFGGGQSAPQVGADIRLTGSSEGGAISRLYGWSRLGGNIVWATELEEISAATQGSKGFGSSPEAEERTIAASFAVALCEGDVARLGRVWADGQLLETAGLNLRFYRGTEEQQPDSLIEAVQGNGNAPAYRGVCYLVFERLPLAPFGNRIPAISAELCRPVGELEPQIRAVNVIPAAGEFIYDPVPRVRLVRPGVTEAENTHLSAEVSDWALSIDELVALCPNLEHVLLVVSWFGDDLRCNHCTIAPRTEGTNRSIVGTTWSVAGLSRATAQVSSMHQGLLAYGGTPSDNAVKAAIADLKARGLKVTLYPLMMMDIPADNPMGQPAYPWRGRISCDPAPGAEGTPDGTAAAAAQVATFVAGYRDFILHYADLAVAAGGIDTLVIGTEMKALTAVRGADDSFPFVAALVTLAEDVRAVVGSGCKLTYAADWSEITGVQPGGGAKFFHLDPLWASPHIDAVAIDNYMPAADWRDGSDHADAAHWDGIHDPEYIKANIGGGEGYDWYYASETDRLNGVRAPISDDAHDEPWVWRFKDLVGWWSNAHHDRPGGVRNATPTAWVPQSKPIWFTEIGCGAVDKGANQPSAFGDPKSVENTRPFFSSGTPDPLMQRQYLRAQFDYWSDAAHNPPSAVYAGTMVDIGRMAPWAWDARPYPAFPADREAWGDWPNYATGHWLNGRLGGVSADELIRAIARDYGVEVAAAQAAGMLIHGYAIESVGSARDAMAPVLAAAGLGVRDTAEGLVFARASARAPRAIARDDLAMTDAAFTARRRPDGSEATGQLALGYTDRERGYLAASVTARTLTGGAAAAERTSLVFDPPGARRAVERMLIEAAASRDTLDFALPASELALEAGDDAVVLEGQGAGPFEITATRDSELRRISARAMPPMLDMAITSDGTRATKSASVARSLPFVVAGHLPPEPANPGVSRLMLAAAALPWPGRVTINHAATGAFVARLDRAATIGTLLEHSGTGPVAVWDRGNSISLELLSGHLASADDLGVLAGGNRIAVETDDGRWEVIGFAEAELVAPAGYRLSRLLRGQAGTEKASGSAGSRVVVLDAGVALVEVPTQWLGDTLGFVAYAGAADPTGTELEVALDLAPVLPLAPVHLSARRAESGDVVLTWVRRSRADTESWALTDSPLELVPEAYRVVVHDGGGPVREITTATQGAIYTLGQQVADFGTAPASFTFSVAQLSPIYGPGHAAIQAVAP